MKKGILVPKQVTEHVDADFGICVWELEKGVYVQNKDGDYFCAQGKVGDLRVEKRMVEAVASLDIKKGRPVWFPGFRKITQSEWEDQMERLLDGKVPDIVDVYRQASKDGES